MEILHNNQKSNYIIVNFKIKNENTEKLDIINNYYIAISNWIKIILDKYDDKINWKFYICNLNFKVIRVFITIDKNIYAKMDEHTESIYIQDHYINNYNYLINTMYFYYLFNINDITKLLENYIDYYNIIVNDEKTSNNYLSSDDSDNSDNTQSSDDSDSTDIETSIQINTYCHKIIKNSDTLINIIGISGVSKTTFISELEKIPILKLNYYNTNYVSNNIYHDDLYYKTIENNKLFWVTTYNNLLSYSATNMENNTILYNFTKQI
jgi:hypothetical protein